MSSRLAVGGVLTAGAGLVLYMGRLDVAEMAVVMGWLAVGAALTLPAYVAGGWLPRVALAATTAAQLIRLRAFVGPMSLPPEDFAIVFESARRLYRLSENPYIDPRANSFPFPAYAMFDAAGLWGRLDAADASRVFIAATVLPPAFALAAVVAASR